MTRSLALLAGTVLALAGGAAHADSIGTTQLSASTSLGQYLYFALDQINDGITSDAAPYNGYASGFGVVSGRISFTLDQAYDLDSFVLWNDINVLNEGVRSFQLRFEDSAGASLGSTGTLLAGSMLAPQTYTFSGTVSGVRTVHMDVLASNLQIEIREVAFNGAVASVPEPATAASLLAGLASLALLRRRRG